jgi:anti-sigma factor ChrR (cupin superfamily)
MNSKGQKFEKPSTIDEIRELAHLHATEGFAENDVEFHEWLEQASEEERSIFSEEVNAVGVLALAVTEPVTAPPLNLGAIVGETGRRRNFPAGFTHVPAAEGEWRELPVKGARIKELSDDRADGFTTMLLEMDAGARFPAHHHHGAEQVYLLDGDLWSDGEELSPGDFLRAAADSDHGGLYSKGGCHALIITARENYPRRSIHLYDRLAKGVRRVKRKILG